MNTHDEAMALYNNKTKAWALDSMVPFRTGKNAHIRTQVRRVTRSIPTRVILFFSCFFVCFCAV